MKGSTGGVETYERVSEASVSGEALYRRKDGRVALAKTSWFKDSPPGSERPFMPRSRTKAIRLDGLHWQP